MITMGRLVAGRHPVARGALAGGLLGTVWGVLARVFMRLVSTDPEFTWVGTLSIIGMSAVLGAGLGAVHGARVGGGRRWWSLAPLPGMLLFASPGMVLLPAFAGGVVAGRFRAGRLRLVVRAVGLLLSFGMVASIVLATDPSTAGALNPPQPVALVPGIVLIVVATALMALAGSSWSGRWPEVVANADRVPVIPVSEERAPGRRVDARR